MSGPGSDAERWASLWFVLASEVRLRVLAALEEEDYGTRELSEKFGIARQRMRYHLNELEHAGLIEETQREAISGGALIRYGVTYGGWVDLLAAVERFATQG